MHPACNPIAPCLQPDCTLPASPCTLPACLLHPTCKPCTLARCLQPACPPAPRLRARPRPACTAQVVLLWLVLLLGFQSAGFAHRTLGASDYIYPERFGAGVALAALLALSSSMSSLVVGPATLGAALSSAPWYVYVLGVGTAVLAHATDTAVKRHDRRAFERTNKGMYLEFTTKLGMHSPIEPGHRTPTSYLDDNT